MPALPSSPPAYRVVGHTAILGDALQELLNEQILLEASAPTHTRVVAGCSPKPQAVPSPRLVCVELNPGPRAGRRGKKSKLTVTTKTTTSLPRSRAPPPTKQRKRAPRSVGSSALQQYLASISNPFHVAPPPLGFDNFGTINQTAAWLTAIGVNTGDTTSTAFTVCHTPSTIYGGGTAAYPGTTETFMKVALLPDAMTPLTSATSVKVYNAANSSYLSQAMGDYLPVTAGLRVTVRYPGSTTPGRLYALTCVESDFALASATPNALISLPACQPITQIGAGVATVEIRFKPSWNGDFMSTAINTDKSYLADNSRLMVIGVGWPANSVSVDFDVISHLEYVPGVLPGGSPNADTEALALTITRPQLGNLVRRIPASSGVFTMLAEDSYWHRSRSGGVGLGQGNSASSQTGTTTRRAHVHVPPSAEANAETLATAGSHDYVEVVRRAVLDGTAATAAGAVGYLYNEVRRQANAG